MTREEKIGAIYNALNQLPQGYNGKGFFFTKGFLLNASETVTVMGLFTSDFNKGEVYVFGDKLFAKDVIGSYETLILSKESDYVVDEIYNAAKKEPRIMHKFNEE